MKKAILFSVTICAVLNIGNVATAKDRVISVDKDFQPANMRWTGANAGGYEGRVAIKNNGGYFEVCGVGAITNIQLSDPIWEALRGGKFAVNGKTALKDFSFFAKARNKKALTSAKANCRRTDMKIPRKIESIKFEYGRAVFRN